MTSVDVPAMDEGQTTLPVEMIPFINTPVAQPFINGRNAGLIGSLALSVLLFVVLSLLTSSTKFALGLASATLVLNATVLLLRFRSHASTPLAVNLNHPFMEGEPLGDAAVMVRLSDGTWRDPGRIGFASFQMNCWVDSASLKTPWTSPWLATSPRQRSGHPPSFVTSP